MYTLLRAIPSQRLVKEQAPAFATSFIIANSFYKFGSFGLELIAFLATWFLIDALIQLWRHLAKKTST
ncbi:MAG: hypothetical protein AMJ53_09230 [Gammaproteobacteria bacterium SG8_11]|nr:MAG: hypothetical protein AMJ53_09230 [Gammaproteobacteria bacterium SG8_11]